MIWVTGRSPTLVSHSLRGVAMNLKATTLSYLAILPKHVAVETAESLDVEPHKDREPKLGCDDVVGCGFQTASPKNTVDFGKSNAPCRYSLDRR